jgi:hypothetical protein
MQTPFRALATAALLTGTLLQGQTLLAADTYRPFIMAEAVNTRSLETVAAEVEKRLTQAGLEIVGQYSPYPGATIYGVSSPELKKQCSDKKHGGFAAVMHVAVTATADGHEISYTNPSYFGYAYQVGALDSMDKKLAAALGSADTFGAKEGIAAKDLSNWRYMWGMPYFEDAVTLEKFPSHKDAVEAVSRALNNSESDMKQIWRVDVGSKQTLFGVQLARGYWSDNRLMQIMATLDTGGPKHTASLPWEILVYDNTVVYLPGKYRIALTFPDLSMGTFMRVSDVPGEMDKSAEKLIKLAK